MNKKVFLPLAALVLAALACSFSPNLSPILSTSTPLPTDTRVPTYTFYPTYTSIPPTIAPSDQNILFQDDFSDVNSGWDRISNERMSTDYATGGYRINVIKEQWSAWSNPNQGFQNDVRIEVDATKIGGPDDNYLGLQCRYQDVDNYYYFDISSDGYAGIGIVKAGKAVIISPSSAKMTSDSSVHQGAATNHIRVDCIGNTLTLYINGNLALTATDSSFTGGDVGLEAGTGKDGGTDILFTNFFVYKP